MKTEAEIKEAIQLLKDGSAIATMGPDTAINLKIRLSAIAAVNGLMWALGEPSALDTLINGIKQSITEYEATTRNHRD